MTLFFIRIFLLIISSFVGLYMGSIYNNLPLGTGIGFGSGLALILLETSLRRVSVRGLSSMVFGLLLGIFMAKLVADIISLLPLGEPTQSVSRVVLTLIFSYLGAVMALRGKDEFHVIIPYVRFKRQEMDERLTILDTSAIVDGRIVGIYKSDFFLGRLVVPRIVLQELQRLADSDDPLKRGRGRRGLEVLRNMQKDPSIVLRIHEDDVPGQDVDTKLIRLAKILDARILTTDYNLSRIADIQDVSVLNINELASAVRAVVLPGEEMEVRLIREGKEPQQAIAFTDDGAMIVVADGRKFIGQNVRVSITSVLPTQSGRTIFAKLAS